MEPNPFISLVAFPNYSTGHILHWKIDPAFYRTEPYLFFVEVSGTIDFSELLACYSVGNSCYFIDKSNMKQDTGDSVFYRILLEVGDQKYISESTILDGPASTSRQFRIASEILRKEILRSAKFTGAECYLLKLRTFGIQASDESIDPVTGLALTATSPNYGQQKTNGYYKPLPIYISIENRQTVRQLNPDGTGVLEATQILSRVPGFPGVETNDIIVDSASNLRYLVKDRQATIFPGTGLITSQTLKLSLLPVTDPVYTISINQNE